MSAILLTLLRTNQKFIQKCYYFVLHSHMLIRHLIHFFMHIISTTFEKHFLKFSVVVEIYFKIFKVWNKKSYHYSKYHDSHFYSFFFKGKIIITFLASLILHQRPNRCSCPTPAIRKLPSLEN